MSETGNNISVNEKMREKMHQIWGERFPDAQQQKVLKICESVGLHEADDIPKYLEEDDIKGVLRKVELQKFREFKEIWQQGKQQTSSVSIISQNGGTMENVDVRNTLVSSGNMENTRVTLGSQASRNVDEKDLPQSHRKKLNENAGPIDNALPPNHDEANRIAIVSQDGGTMKKVEVKNTLVNRGNMKDTDVTLVSPVSGNGGEEKESNKRKNESNSKNNNDDGTFKRLRTGDISIISQGPGGKMGGVTVEGTFINQGEMKNATISLGSDSDDEKDKNLDMRLQNLRENAGSIEDGIPPNYGGTSGATAQKDDIPSYYG